MVAATVFDYRRLRAFIPVGYLATLLLLVLVLTPLGTSVRGSQRWISLLGFQVQPSELMKIALLLALAMLFNETEGVPGLGRTATRRPARDRPARARVRAARPRDLARLPVAHRHRAARQRRARPLPAAARRGGPRRSCWGCGPS
jgi:hypothetical protein